MPVLNWVLLAIVVARGTGAGAAAVHLHGKYRTERAPPLPILEGEEPLSWYLKARGIGAFLKKSLKTNVQLRKDLEAAKRHALEVAQLKKQEGGIRGDSTEETPHGEERMEGVMTNSFSSEPQSTPSKFLCI